MQENKSEDYSEDLKESETIPAPLDTPPEENSSEQGKEVSEILDLIKVRFWGNPRPHTFQVGDLNPTHGKAVVAESDRGLALGLINSFRYQKKVSPSQYPKIERMADDADLQKNRELLKIAREIKRETTKIVDELKLKMTLSHVAPVDFDDKFVVYFTAPERVDFRELVRQLKIKFKEKMELRQIDQHQKMEALGVMGGCGHASSYFLMTASPSEKKYYPLKKAFTRL